MAKGRTILVVEDDENLAYLIQEALRSKGFAVVLARDGAEALAMERKHSPHLVVLDILLPGMDGWETCHHIRETSNVPILILSCLGNELDKVRGLELGADDYMTKPFTNYELVARVRALLRRAGRLPAEQSLVWVDQRLSIDRERNSAFIDGKPVHLSAVEHRLLLCLVDNAGHTLTHRSLLSQAWGWEYVDEIDSLKVHIHHLRKKLEVDSLHPRYILTERSLGYRFEFPEDS